MLTKERTAKIKRTIDKEGSRLAIIFNALSDPGRLRIFGVLTEHNGLCVTDVANVLGVSVPAVSHQLRVLEMSGLITKDRIGQTVCYKIRDNDQFVKSINKLISQSDKN